MSTVVKILDDGDTRQHSDEPDVHFNESAYYVLLRPITIRDLRNAWFDFNARLATALLRLMSMPTGEVVARYGLMDMSPRFLEEREQTEFGLVSENGRFYSLNRPTVVSSLVSIGAVAATTARGNAREKIKSEGGVAGYINTLGLRTRKKLLENLLQAGSPLDDILRLGQSSIVGDQEIEGFLHSTGDAMYALEVIADRTERFFHEQKSAGSSQRKGAGRIYGWAWLAQHLSVRGIWLQPAAHITDIINLFPRKFQPVSAWLAVPDHHFELAEQVLNRATSSKSTSYANILSVFLTIAQCSNAFSGDGMRAWPFVFFKAWAQASGSGLRSSSASNLFKLLCNYHSIDVATHPVARNILGLKRLVGKGVDAFAWCDRPNPRNTRLAEKCLGRKVETIPWWVRDWADCLRSSLRLFGTKSVRNQVSELQTWLIFLLTLEERKAPKSFREVVRRIHVNDGEADSHTYVNFLTTHFAKGARGTGYRAPSTLAKAWYLIANRDGFVDQTNPFDVRIDRAAPAPKRLAKSTRRPLDESVRNILLRENRRDDFAFARSRDTANHPCWYYLENVETGRFEEVFFPHLPILINVILNSGARKSTARWLDSGEGDEFRVDVENKQEVPNKLASATKQRCQGFIRVFDFTFGATRRRELGMYLNTSKSSAPYGVPWIEPSLALEVLRLQRLQEIYNPMREPILARELGLDSIHGATEDVPDVFPLFRDPKYPLHYPLSDDKIARYWLKLLKHCEPIIAREFGYTYPLVNGNKPLFDIHALRVTMVSVLLDNEVPIEIVQTLVGHSTIMMTWYYNHVRQAKIYEELQRAFTRLNADVIGSEDIELIERISRESIQAVPVDDPEGLFRLRKHAANKTAPIDYFAHGICPGGDCSTGGKKISEGRYSPVFRQRACSRCRYRVTGPLFLHGLVHRLNGLMFEISESIQRLN